MGLFYTFFSRNMAGVAGNMVGVAGNMVGVTGNTDQGKILLDRFWTDDFSS